MRLKLIWADFLVLSSFLLNLGAQYAQSLLQATLKGYVSNVNALEANPLRGLILFHSMLSFVTLAAGYALLFAIYIFFRRRASKSREWEFAFLLFTLLFFFIFATDFANDVVVLLPLIW